MTLVLIVFAVLLVLGMPVAFAMAIAGFIFFLQQPMLPLTMPVQRILSETQSFSLLAIPMFVFAGNLMNETGITRRLMKFASVLVGHMWGGVAQVSVVLSTLMGTVSGSAIADASMESDPGPSMLRSGSTRYPASINGFSALITIDPPSIGLVLCGSIGEVSVGRLLAGGIGPGLTMALFLGIAVSITARLRGYKPQKDRPSGVREIVPAAASTFWAILFPFLLLVTLRFGLLVPSEAGATAAVYAMFVGLFVYREMTWEGFKLALRMSVLDMGMIMFLIALSSLVSYGLTWEMIPQKLSRFLLGVSANPMVIVGIIVLFLFFLGMFIDSTVIILLLTSILVPIMRQVGVDLVWFGVLMVVTCAFGLLTPPVGLAMYSVCSIMECSVAEFMRDSWPFSWPYDCHTDNVSMPPLITTIPNLIFG